MGTRELSYTILPQAIADTMEKARCPLTEKQKDVLMGSLALYQLKIEHDGLESLIQNLIKQGG